MDPATEVVPTEKKRGRKAAPKKTTVPSKKRLKVKSAVIVSETPKSLVEYVYKKKRVGKNEYVIDRKIGVLYGTINQVTGRICIGFSVCHNSKDRFDYIRGLIHKPGHGLNMATQRAKRWSTRDYYDIGADVCWGEINPVSIPSMIYEPLCNFIERCNRYFQGCFLPKWAADFASDYRKMMLVKG
jgi:hypothetical protein